MSSSRAPLLPTTRRLPPRPPSLSRRRPVSGFYEPAVDRSATYRLSRRSRFWPGTDELAGWEWSYWYGDISLPRELHEPRPPATCLGDEALLDTMLLKQMGLLEDKPATSSYRPLPSRRRGGSVGPLASTVDATEQAINHVENAKRIRATSLSRMHETTRSVQNSVTFRDVPARSGVRVPTERRVHVDSGSSRPPRPFSPRPRTFTDMKSEYDHMLSRMGVTKELTVKHGHRQRRI